MPVIPGTVNADTLIGGAGADTLRGFQGNDLYLVNGLANVIEETGFGDLDTVRTSVLDGVGGYSIVGLTSIENLEYVGTLGAYLSGNFLNNRISGDATRTAADTLRGDSGNDSLFGYRGTDVLFGGQGNDVLDGGTGDDTMIGGQGDDLFLVDSLDDVVIEFSFDGFDTIESSVLKDIRSGFSQIEGLTFTGTGNVTLRGNGLGNAIRSNSSGTDVLYGYGGNDTLDGGSGTDTLYGGRGDDVFRVSSTDVVVEVVGGGRDTVIGTRATINTAPYATTVENIIYTGAGDTTVDGNAMDNLVSGGSGDDRVNGLDGNDTVIGGDGRDRVSGGSGDDWLAGNILTGTVFAPGLAQDNDIDTLAGSFGNDRYLIDNRRDLVTELSGQGTADVIEAMIDADLSLYDFVEGLHLVDASTTAFIARGSSRGDIIVGNTNENLIEGLAGNDTLSGWSDSTNFFYGGTADALFGGDGDDALIAFSQFGYGGYDAAMFGGLGDDLYILSTSGDVSGRDSGGVDTAIYMRSGSAVDIVGLNIIRMYDETMPEAAAVLLALQRAAAVAKQGGTVAANQLSEAFDLLDGDQSRTIFGNTNANDIKGGGGSDTIDGGAGRDVVYGGDGDDRLVAGLQDAGFGAFSSNGDRLYGDDPANPDATGADTFVFDVVGAPNRGVETFNGSGDFKFTSAAMIFDFLGGTDRIAVNRTLVGDGDTSIENAVVDTTAGGTFAANAELVIFRANMGQPIAPSPQFGFTPIDADNAIAIIGAAASNFAVGAERLFVLDDGTTSAVFQFVAANADAAVTADELALVAVVLNDEGLTASDFVLV